MLYQLFTKILTMSFTASFVIVTVLFVRGTMHRMPRKYLYALWVIVGIRLLCPTAVSSPISLFNILGQQSETHLALPTDYYNRMTEKTSENVLQIQTDTTQVQGKIIASQQEESDIVSPTVLEKNIPNKHPYPIIKYGSILWLSGIAFLFSRNLYAVFRIKKQLKKAVRYQKNIYECGNIPSPFVAGIIHPKIYIPFHLKKEERGYILKHEQYHIRRKDYIIKPAAFLLTSLYWFHPLVWLSYTLMIRDMEMSCDEYVLQNADSDIRINYSKSLLGFAVNQRGMTAGLLPFGESDARRRIKKVLNYKTYGKWIGILAILILIVTGAVCLTDKTVGKTPSKEQNINKKEPEVTAADTPKNPKPIVLSEKTIHGYQVQIAYLPDSQTAKNEESENHMGMYEGKFAIQTYKNHTMYAEYTLQLAETMYFPADGFDLTVKDYDGDGNENDFSLGQGQMPIPILGNYMNYFFFSVKEDGSIIQYALSTQNGESLFTIPGDYSKNFSCKDGVITYDALGKNGVKKQKAKIIQKTSQ